MLGTSVSTDIKKAEVEFDANRKDPLSESRLHDAYSGAINNLPWAVLELLQRSSVQVTPLVWLIGKDLTPFARDAAPIHKLLISHARECGIIRYVRGVLSADSNGTVTVAADEDVPSVSRETTVIRHGADNALKSILKKKLGQLEELANAQRTLSDDLINPFWMTSANIGLTSSDPKSKKFQSEHFLKAKKIERLWPDLRLTRGKKGLCRGDL